MNKLIKYALMFAFIGIALFAINQMSDGAEAADIVWDGGGTTELASEAANWAGDVRPVNDDNAIYNGTSQKDCTWDYACVPYITTETSYHGTISVISTNVGIFTLNGGTVNIYNNPNAYVLQIQDDAIVNIYLDLQIAYCYGGIVDGGTLNANGHILTITNQFQVYNNGFEINGNITLLFTGNSIFSTGDEKVTNMTIDNGAIVTQVGNINLAYNGSHLISGQLIYDSDYTFHIDDAPVVDVIELTDALWIAIIFMSIATIINFIGYVRKIGLLQIVSFLILLAAIFTMTDAWSEGWAIPTLFILSNAVLFIMGMIRKG